MINHEDVEPERRPAHDDGLRRGVPVSRTDKFAIICSALLLAAILAAGGYALRAAYDYHEPLTEEEPALR